MQTLDTFRSYWLALATASLDEQARIFDASTDRQFWMLAGFDEFGDFAGKPPRIEGLGGLAREMLEILTSPEAGHSRVSACFNHAVRWCGLAERDGLLDDGLLAAVINFELYPWVREGYFDSEDPEWPATGVAGTEPAAVSPGTFQRESRLALAERFDRVTHLALEKPEAASSRFLAFLDFTGRERLLQACRHIERLEVKTLSHRATGDRGLEEILARMAASHFDPDEEPGWIRELEGFQTATLLLVEDYSDSARPLLRRVLAGRPGAPELLRLKDELVAGLMRPGEYSESPRAPASGEFDAKRMRRLITAVPAGIFQWFRDTLTAGDLAESMAIVLDALRGTNRPKLEKSLKHHSQMALKSLALLPLPELPADRAEEVRKRYLRIDEFVKSSRNFGVQRQANNRTCAEIALGNLALNAGYDDADELFFEVESRLAADSTGAGFASGGYRVGLEFDASGPSIIVERDGKPLKSLPPALKKSAGYKELKETFDVLREQSRRFRRALEKRMAVAAAIEWKAFESMWQAPLLRGLLATLVFVDEEGASGMVDARGETMNGPDGARVALKGRALRIAHPVVLERLGVLAAWRQQCLEREVVQALRQVFREFYTLTPAELASSPVSFRFAGHWMAGGILSGLLKSRGWSCVGNDGPEPRKSFGSAGITGHFDLEECGHYLTETESVRSAGVSFRDPTGGRLPLDAVPATIFSEVMRDADLFVSVAQTTEGGVPSKELVAQRVALLQGLIGKLRIKGVTVEGHHALIEGKRCRYRVHLASGAVHLGDNRHLCIVPAASWKRPAKLFLPFVEEDDRRIAEIFSKILLLANDDKITDPGILAQIGQAGGR
jgi:hypothetical protein